MTRTLMAFGTLTILLAAEAATAQSAILLVRYIAGSMEICSADVDGDSPPLQLTDSAQMNYSLINLNDEKIGIAVSPRGDRIAFVANRGGNRDIYLLDADGTGEVPLTTHEAKDDAPAWSPDGQRIAFRSDRSGDPEIYIVGPDGSGLTRLTDSPGKDYNPAWSPDGSRIAFTSLRNGVPRQVFVMDADGGNVEQLTDNGRWSDFPSWSPDGQQLVFQSQFANPPDEKIVRLDLATGEETPLYSGFAPSWAPGDRILFADWEGHDDLYLHVGDALGNEFIPSWSHQDPEAIWLPDPTGTLVRSLSWGAIKRMMK